MKKNFIYILIFAMLLLIVSCSNDSEKLQNDDKTGENNPQNTQVNPQNDEQNNADTQTYPQNSEQNDENTQNSNNLDTIFDKTIISLESLSSDEILDIKQRFLTMDISVPFNETLDEQTLEAISAFKTLDEAETPLLDTEIYKSDFDSFFTETDEKFTNFGDDLLFLTNKNLSLKYDYVPEDLTLVNALSSREILMTPDAASALEQMMQKSVEDGFNMMLVSGYRSFDYQSNLFQNKMNSVGFEDANKVVALPGESEHQTGLAIDITCESIGYSLVESFENTPEFAWLYENCADYGFILRYLKDSTDITGYSYEPWHYRYIGDTEIANFIMDNGLTLEEYHEIYLNT